MANSFAEYKENVVGSFDGCFMIGDDVEARDVFKKRNDVGKIIAAGFETSVEVGSMATMLVNYFAYLLKNHEL